jgi:hypothetical protein
MGTKDALGIEDLNEREWRDARERASSNVRSVRPKTKTKLAISFMRFERRLARVRRYRINLWELSDDVDIAATNWIHDVKSLVVSTSDGFKALVLFGGACVLLISSVFEAIWAALSLIFLLP